jgi:hypothetical protein
MNAKTKIKSFFDSEQENARYIEKYEDNIFIITGFRHPSLFSRRGEVCEVFSACNSFFISNIFYVRRNGHDKINQF